jgi:hypothetical protein
MDPVRKGKPRGQASVEYILMVAFGAFFSIQVSKIFLGIFHDGLAGLETNVQSEVETGRGFVGNQ